MQTQEKKRFTAEDAEERREAKWLYLCVIPSK